MRLCSQNARWLPMIMLSLILLAGCSTTIVATVPPTAVPTPTPTLTHTPTATPPHSLATETPLPTISDEKDSEEQIAFIAWEKPGVRGIYTVRSDGTNLACVTSDFGIGPDVTWSPDHSQIAFSYYPFIQIPESPDRYSHYLYLMSSSGGGLTQISTKKDTFGPVWSPDGQKIAYHWRPPDSHPSKILIAEIGSGQEMILTPNEADSILGGWSSDGEKLYFLSNQEGSRYEVYTINADGSQQRKLTDTGLNKFDLSVSPDGTKLLFMGATARTDKEMDMTGMPDTAYKLFVMNSDGSGLREILFGQEVSSVQVLYSPTWSRDGTRIAFLGVDPRTIYVIGSDGENLQQLIQEQDLGQYGEISHPSWSIDGTKIAFRCYDGDICIMNRDGTSIRRLNVHPLGQSPLHWIYR